MRVTTLNVLNTSRDMIRVFRGYNHQLLINDNEWYDMTNMTSDYYPVLSPRNKRMHIANYSGTTNGLFAKSKLLWVKDTNLYYNGALVGQVANSKKQFVSMGALVLIFPDKKVFNTSAPGKGLTDMEATWNTNGVTVTYKLAKVDGTEYGTPTVSATAPDAPEDGDLWMDTSATVHILKQWSSYSEMWVEIPTVYIRIESANIGSLFNQYDGITISGSTISALNTSNIIQAIGTDYIVVTGLIDQTSTQSTNLTIKREVPDMDYLTEHNNRVWGCSSINHEVYCCKIGDPYNWNAFEGLSTDSYAATIGSDGDFTGAITYGNYVLFFKEDKVHFIQGDKPANFVIGEKALRGVEKGSEKSLCVVDEILYYKSPEGVVAYTGSLPESIYEVFGGVRYKYAVGGGARSKYYISMQNQSDNIWNLFCYDSKKRIWHKEDNLNVEYFARYDNDLFYMDALNNFGSIFGTTGNNNELEVEGQTEEEGSVSWSVETGNIGMDSPDQKTISRFLIRLKAEELNTVITVAMQYDSSGIWENKRTITTQSLTSFNIPVIPKRCDHMRIKISGTGPCKIFSISKETEQGSELHGNL